jgi:GAF domain-containing protein
MTVPFQTGDEWNLIQLEKEGTQRWKEEDQALVRQVVDQLGLALQNAQLFQQTQRQNTNLAVLNEMGRELAAQLSIEQVVDTAYKFIGQLMDTSSFFIALFNPGSETLNFPLVTVNRQRIHYPERKIGSGLTDYVLRTQKPLLLNGDVSSQMQALGIQFLTMGNTNPAVSWLGAPLIIGNKTLGAIVVQSTQTPYLYTEQHRDLLVAVASQAAIALQNAQLFQQTEEQNKSLEILNEMGRELTSLRSIPKVAESLHKYTSQLMHGETFLVSLHNPSTASMDVVYFVLNNQKQPLTTLELSGMTGWVYTNKKPLLLNGDIEAETKALGITQIPLDENDDLPLISWLGVPLLLGAEILGAMVVQSLDPAIIFGERERDLLMSIASQASISIQNARLFDETQKSAQQTTAVAEIATNITSILELQHLLETAVHLTQRRFGLYHAHIFLPEKDNQVLVVKACGWRAGDPLEGTNGTQEISLDDTGSLVAQAAREKKSVINNAVRSKPNWLPNPLLPDTQSEMAVPVLLGERVLGVLNLHADKTNFFTNADLSIMTTLSTQIASAIENARLFEETQKRTNELATLNEIVSAVSEQIELKQVLEVVYQEVKKLVPMDVFFVGLYDEKTKLVSFPLVIDEGVYYNEVSTPINPANFTGRTILSGKTLHETLSPEEASQTEEIDGAIGNTTKKSGSVLFIPLKLGQRTIGCLSIQSYHLLAYSEESVTLIENVSNQISTAIQNATLFEETQRRSDELAIINELIRETAQSLDSEDICKSAYKYVGQLMDTNCFLVALYDDKRNLRHAPLVYDEGQQYVWPDAELDNGATSWVIRNNRVLFLPANATELAKEYGCEFVKIGNNRLPQSWLGVPLSFGDKALGAIVVQSTIQSNLYTEHHRDLLISIASQLAIVLENARLYNQEQYRRSVADALSDMARIAGSSLDLKEIVNRLLAETPRLLKFRTAIIQLVGKEDRLEQVGAIRIESDGAHEMEPPKERSSAPVQDFPLLNELHEKREPIFILDTLKDARWKKTNETAEVRAWLGAPLIVSNRVIGLLLLHDDKPNTYNEESATLARSIAAQVASSIYNTQLFKQAQDRARREQLLREITSRVRSSTDPDSIMRTVVRELGQALGMQTFINLGDPKSSADKASAPDNSQETRPQPSTAEGDQ